MDLPVTLLTRKMFKMDVTLSNVIESIVLSLMFFGFIFTRDIYTGITLGVISLILILLGLIFKYKSFSYVGYITLAITVFIQTIHLWGSIPWWVYLLVTGIVLVAFAAIKESKKK